MNNAFKIKTGLNVEPKTGSTVTVEGDVAYNVTSHQVEVFGASAAESITTNTNTQTLSNKSIDATTNPITNLADANIKSGAAIARNKLASGTAYRLLANDVSGVLSENAALTPTQVTYVDANGQLVSEATLAKSRGGSGQDNSSITFPATGTLVTTTGTETLSNKTFSDAPSFTQVATPSTPASGFNKIYPKADGNFYNLSSSGVEAQIGAGAGSGGLKNYLGTVNNVNGNGNFELGNTNGWSLFNTTLTGVIPTGAISAGAASITTFAATTSGKLAGAYSLNVASSGAITAGQGFISDAFTIDTEDQAKILAQKFAYSVVSGATNLDFSGTSANTWAVYYYDVTNSAWVQPAGVYNLVQNAGVGFSSGTFQTTSNSTQYRLALICINASAGASSMLFDDFSVGQQITASGAAISDWKPYSPIFSGLGAVTNVEIEYRQVGDTYEIKGKLTTGTVTASEARIGLPNSATSADTAKIPSTKLCGQLGRNANVPNTIIPLLIEPSVSYITVGGEYAAGSASGQLILTKQDGNQAFNNNETLSFFAAVPIAGLSSNTVMSSDTDTRVVAASAYLSTNTSITANTPITWDVISYDTHASFSSGRYTAPVSGIYSICGTILENTSPTNLTLYKNGSAYKLLPYLTTNLPSGFSEDVQLIAGDIIDIRPESTVNVLGTSSVSTFSVKRLSGPATIAASETVAARYNATTTPTLSSGSPAGNIIDYDTKVIDTHSAVTNAGAGYNVGWKFTSPISGLYSISACITISGSWDVSADNMEIRVRKNGVDDTSSGYITQPTRASGNLSASTPSVLLQLNAGEYVDAYLYFNSGSIKSPLGIDSTISIMRIGN